MGNDVAVANLKLKMLMTNEVASVILVRCGIDDVEMAYDALAKMVDAILSIH